MSVGKKINTLRNSLRVIESYEFHTSMPSHKTFPCVPTCLTVWPSLRHIFWKLCPLLLIFEKLVLDLSQMNIIFNISTGIKIFVPGTSATFKVGLSWSVAHRSSIQSFWDRKLLFFELWHGKKIFIIIDLTVFELVSYRPIQFFLNPNPVIHSLGTL